MPKVDFVGLKLNNPVLVASATPSISADKIKKAAEAGAGAVVTKSVIFPEPNGKPAGAWGRPRFMVMNHSTGYDPKILDKNAYMTFYRTGEPYPTPDEMAKMLDELKKGSGKVDIPIIVSICGHPNDYKSWKDLARLMEDAGADALELNMHAWRPAIKYTDPLFVKAVKDEVKIPVICKLMAINDDPEIVGPQVELAGADAITGLGTFGQKALEIDIENQRPYLGTYHGLGGSWLRAVSLAYVAKLAGKVSVPISGVTGVQSWQDAIKYMLVGASTVQVCGAIYARGYKVLSEIADGIDAYMKENGYKSIDDFRGNALANMKAPEYAPPVRAQVNPEKCNGCKRCQDICLFDGLEMKDGKAFVNEKCDACGVCWSFCPNKAIDLVRY